MLTTTLERFTGFDSVVLLAFDGRQAPVLLFDDLKDPYIARSLQPYLAGAYLLDPFYELVREGTHDGFYHMSDCAPDDFLDSDYYRTFYRNCDLVDEIGFFANVSERLIIHASLGRRLSGSNAGGADLLTSAAPILTALCKRQWAHLNLSLIHI